MDNAVTACHETYLGMTLHEVFAKLLRHAAAHAHHGARIDLPDPPERTVHLQFRLFPHGAGIQKHHIGLLQRALGKTAPDKSAGNPPGVVDVHLTTKGQAMKSGLRHIPSCGRTPAHAGALFLLRCIGRTPVKH